MKEAGLDAELELDGLLPGSRERPADVGLADAPGAFCAYAPGLFLAIDVRIARVHEASYLSTERAHPGSTVEGIETAKRTQYASRVTAEGGRFVPFVLDEFGKLGASAVWLLHAVALRAAERQRADFRYGATLDERATRFRTAWTGLLTGVLHTTVTGVIHRRFLASLRATVSAPVVGYIKEQWGTRVLRNSPR